MARWKALPDGLDPAVGQFVVLMRRLKDDSGLTLKQIADRTGYSTSSWERYLGGRLLPPPGAAEALADLLNTDLLNPDRVRLLARYEAAASAWRDDFRGESIESLEPTEPDGVEVAESVVVEAAEGSEAERPPTASAEEPITSGIATGTRSLFAALGQWLRRAHVVIGAAVSGAAVGTAVTALVLQSQHKADTSAHLPPVIAVASPIAYHCDYANRDGLWFAGDSTTTTQRLTVDMSGPAVAEMQCLLQRIGDSPGGIDGHFGPMTLAALIKAQKSFHLDVDGVVGPQTWGALRR